MLTMISWNLFYPRLHDGFNILCKNIENELRVYLSQQVALQLPMLDFFIMLYFHIPKFHVPSQMFFFKLLQIFIIHESAKDRNLRAFF